MKLLFVNCICGTLSTGKIVVGTAARYEKEGWDIKIVDSGYAPVPDQYRRWAVPIGGAFSRIFHQLMTRFFDWHGDRLCSYLSTRRFLRWVDEWKPDVLWLHNIHGYYINYELLFDWIKRHPKLEVKWTLHDCWAFTGHCSYFTMAGCEKWMVGCGGSCPCKGDYPKSWLFSAAKTNWERKQAAFCGVKKMTLIAPSKWLADLTRKSFLREYPVEVVHNTIDATIFVPTPSDIKNRLGITGKRLILGVASTWDRRKGLADFLHLRTLLAGHYVIVLVGLTVRQKDSLPEGVMGLSKTNSARELVELYSAADWFFNPTYEENFPTVNLEARACGCRIVTYDTGGCVETVSGYDRAVVLSGSEKSPEGFCRVIKSLDKEVCCDLVGQKSK